METFFLLSRKMIRSQWAAVMSDPDNPRPDIQTADEYIAAIERGEFKILGATVVLQDTLRRTELPPPS